MRVKSLQPASQPIWWSVGGGRRRVGTSPIDGRRAVVRAAVRALVAEQGVEGLHMRQLADRCSIAVQTLYNNFGGRDAVLLAAVEEYTEFCLDLAWQEAKFTRGNAIYAVGDITARLLIEDFPFIHELFQFIKANEGHPVHCSIIGLSLSSHVKALQLAQAANSIRPWVDCNLAAAGIHRIMLSMLIELISHTRDAHARALAGAQYRMAIGTSLLGMLQGPDALLLERRLADISVN